MKGELFAEKKQQATFIDFVCENLFCLFGFLPAGRSLIKQVEERLRFE